MTASIDELALKTRVDEVLNHWPVAGLAVGVVRGGSLAWFHRHGVADIGSGTRIDKRTVFRLGSMTKIITAVAVMQLWEQGLVDLDPPASDYLRAYRLIPAGWPPGPRRSPSAGTARCVLAEILPQRCPALTDRARDSARRAAVSEGAAGCR